MTKQEAYEEMLKGNKVRHYNYSPHEWASFIDGQIQTEDGYRHGGEFDEFWAVYQNWPDGWEFYNEAFHDWKLRKKRETDWAYIEKIKEKSSEYNGKIISDYAKVIMYADIDQAQKHVEYFKIEGALNETYCYLKSRLRRLRQLLNQTKEKP